MLQRLVGNPKTGQPAMVFEDIHRTPRRRLFTFWDVSVEVTRWAWINLALSAVAALILTFLFYPSASIFERIGWTVLWTAVIVIGLSIHSLGHIISGKIAGSAMDRLLITATRQVNIYDGDQSQFPPRVHVIRALGGGITNIVVVVMCIILMRWLGPLPTLLILAGINLAGLSAFIPSDSVDGGTILHYLREARRTQG